MVEINLYLTYDSWYKERPDAVIKGSIVDKNQTYIEVLDDSNYNQILILDKFYAITYRKGDYLY